MACVITPATAEEVPQLIDFATEIFGEPARTIAEGEFPTAFTAARCPTSLLVARQHGEIVGLAGVMEDYIYIDTFCICWVGVKKSLRGQGIGSTLMQAAINHAYTLIKRDKGSIVLVAEEKNLSYYARFGFSGNTPIHPYLDNPHPHFLITKPIWPEKQSA